MHSIPDRDRVLTIRGIDTESWSWLRSRAVLERKTFGETLNVLIARYRAEGGVHRCEAAGARPATKHTRK